MLPSMPILFTRDSQDAFGNKIVPSTSFFGQTSFAKPANEPLPPPPKPPPKPEKTKGKGGGKKKEPIVEEPPQLEEYDKNLVFATKFFTKVQSRFASTSRVPNKKFIEFQEILKSFNISNESPLDLYMKMVGFFGESNKDLAEEFLLFLTPSQAAQIGCFMDHFMMSKMNSFIFLLHSTFSRKPTMVRKIIRAIGNSVKCGSLDAMRSKVLPHLRSNPRLAAMFRALFPDERPPENLYESGVDTVDESFLSADRGYDVLRIDHATETRKKLESKEHLDTVYMQGRVFLQHRRLLRPARVSYPYSKEPYRPPPPPPTPTKHNRKQHKNSKDFNDNTKHEKKPRAQTKTKKKETETNKRESKKKDEGPKAKIPKLDTDKKPEKKTDATDKKTADKKSDADRKNVSKIETDKKTNSIEKKSTENKKKVVAENNVEAKIVVADKKEVKNNWTREEDKTMLQIMKCEAVSDEVFVRLKELLPNRSLPEIKERFFHVMTLVQQMAIGDVT